MKTDYYFTGAFPEKNKDGIYYELPESRKLQADA